MKKKMDVQFFMAFLIDIKIIGHFFSLFNKNFLAVRLVIASQCFHHFLVLTKIFS
jgi:hypothetical protein